MASPLDVLRAGAPDDLVLLLLEGVHTPLPPEQVAVLGSARLSKPGQPFRSFGFRSLGDYADGLWSQGVIHGLVPPQRGRRVRRPLVQIESHQLHHGMSGAPVLDVERDLVVGIVSQVNFSSSFFKDAGTAWAVDAEVLSLPPFSLEVHSDAPQRRTRSAVARITIPDLPQRHPLSPVWNNCPPAADAWVGREALLDQLQSDWEAPHRRITGLVGFVGEGKSTLIQTWLGRLLSGPAQSRPDGMFWWTFQDQQNVSAFFEELLQYLTAWDAKLLERYRNVSTRIQFLLELLARGRYLLVLDGMEPLQKSEGPGHGTIESDDVQHFLALFAERPHPSFAVMTSRMPIADLMRYRTYTPLEVGRLDAEEGRELLKALGVARPDAELDRLVRDGEGHAQTLCLLPTLLAQTTPGDRPESFGAIDLRRQQAARLLRHYDRLLSPTDHRLLVLLSALREPIEYTELAQIIGPNSDANPFGDPFACLSADALPALLDRLVSIGLVRRDQKTPCRYSIPLLFRDQIHRGATRELVQGVHQRLKQFYLARASARPAVWVPMAMARSNLPSWMCPVNPTAQDLHPLCEAVHHACQAGEIDQAYELLHEGVVGENEDRLIHKLGEFELELVLLADFFPGGDWAQAPELSGPIEKYWLLNQVGVCMMALGRLAEAVPLLDRSIDVAAAVESWSAASLGHENLAVVHILRGDLTRGEESAAAAENCARMSEEHERLRDKTRVVQTHKNALALKAWAYHLRGHTERARETFRAALQVSRNVGLPFGHALSGLSACVYADHLRRMGDIATALEVGRINLGYLEVSGNQPLLVQAHRVMGELKAQEGHYSEAAHHLEQALELAQRSTRRNELIEALLTAGKWRTQWNDATETQLEEALAQLQEACRLAVSGGYRIHEVDTRVALGWCHLRRGEPMDALEQGEAALRSGEELDYHWGAVDALELNAAIEARTMGTGGTTGPV
jgi:tetratricopeptide (TPR) repeat protein